MTENDPRQSPPPQNESSKAFADLAAAVKSAFEAAKRDVGQAADKAAPKFRRELESGAHDLAYGVSFSLSFVARAVERFVP